MAVVQADTSSIQQGAELIKKGKLVAMPTETVYGLGADAFNPAAVAQIFQVKERPSFDPLIVHIASYSQLVRLCDDMDPGLYKLAQEFWPGPLTLVMKKSSDVPGIVTAGLDTVAIRMPSHPVALELIKTSGTAIAAPSANPFGYVSPTTAQHVHDQLGERVPLILDGGPSTVGVESTIIMQDHNQWYLLRHGGVPAEDIEQFTGPLVERLSAGENPDAPGQLAWHYSPMTPVKIIHDPGEADTSDPGAAFLLFGDVTLQGDAVRNLSGEGDPVEAAVNLFRYLRELDNMNKNIIFAMKVPEEGIGKAVMDRLRKASKRNEKEG